MLHPPILPPLTPVPFTKDRRRRDAPARLAHLALQVLLHAGHQALRTRRALHGALRILQGPQAPHARVGHLQRTVGHPARNQEAARAAGLVALGGGDGEVVAQEEAAAGRGGDILVVNKAVGGRGGDGGEVVVAVVGEEVLRARGGACGGGVLDRRPL